MAAYPDADYLKTTVGETLKKMLLKVAVSARDDGVDPINLLSKLLFSEADAIDARKARTDLKEEEVNAVQAVADAKQAAIELAEKEAIEAAAAAKAAMVADSEPGTYGWMSTMYPSCISTFASYEVPKEPEPEPEPEAAAAEGEADENTTLEGGSTAPVDGEEDAAPAAEGEGGGDDAAAPDAAEGDAAPAAEGEEAAAETDAPAAEEAVPAVEETATPAEEAAPAAEAPAEE